MYTYSPGQVLPKRHDLVPAADRLGDYEGTMGFAMKNDGFCTETPWICAQNDGLCAQNDGWLAKDVPVMAPHDWTGEGMRYGDLHDVIPGGVAGNAPCNAKVRVELKSIDEEESLISY